VAVLPVVLAQCAHPPNPGPAASSARPPAAAPAPEAVRTLAPSRPAPQPAAVSTVTAADLGPTWRPGCPVSPADLRAVDLDVLGFDGLTHRGRLVVHRDITAEVIDVFAELYRLRFPIERMRTPDHYPGGEDELSMRDDNTSAYNCRGIPGSTAWSEHAFGRAVDINPLRNPAVHRSGLIEPATAGPWLDRSRTDPGMLHDGDPAVAAFTARGWTWGGRWRSPTDYQHFELP
jgi:hypothetical protein